MELTGRGRPRPTSGGERFSRSSPVATPVGPIALAAKPNRAATDVPELRGQRGGQSAVPVQRSGFQAEQALVDMAFASETKAT